MKLSDIEIGGRAVIVKVAGHGGFRRRIVEMGFIKGKVVEVLNRAPLGDPIEYAVMGYNVSLRLSEAEKIEVITVAEAEEVVRRSKEQGTGSKEKGVGSKEQGVGNDSQLFIDKGSKTFGSTFNFIHFVHEFCYVWHSSSKLGSALTYRKISTCSICRGKPMRRWRHIVVEQV